MSTLESPHRGDSNEYTQYTIFQYEKEKHPKLYQICSYGIFAKGLKNMFQRALVNEPSVFEPLKFYCIWLPLIRKMECFQSRNWRYLRVILETTTYLEPSGICCKLFEIFITIKMYLSVICMYVAL